MRSLPASVSPAGRPHSGAERGSSAAFDALLALGKAIDCCQLAGAADSPLMRPLPRVLLSRGGSRPPLLSKTGAFLATQGDRLRHQVACSPTNGGAPRTYANLLP